MSVKPLLIAGVLIGATLAIYTALPKAGVSIAPDTVITSQTSTSANGPVAPAEAAPVAQQKTAAMVATPEGETAMPASPIATYASKEECESSTHRECHDVKCPNVPEGRTAAEICGPEFVEGWQAIVPTPDSTAIPEIIAPPMDTTAPSGETAPAP